MTKMTTRAIRSICFMIRMARILIPPFGHSRWLVVFLLRKSAGNAELKIATYKLDSAVSFLKKYARKSRLDVVSKGIERMANEILVKQDRNAWAVILEGFGTSQRQVGNW